MVALALRVTLVQSFQKGDDNEKVCKVLSRDGSSILSLVERDPAAPNLPAAIKLLNGFQRDLPEIPVGAYARSLALKRAGEMRAMLDTLHEESYQGKAL